MIKIELSSYDVEIKEAITWGDQEAIRAAILGGFKLKKNLQAVKTAKEIDDVEFEAKAMLTAKFTAIERCITKITDKDGKDVKFSREWLENLTIEDGDKLSEAVDQVTSPKV